MMLALCGKAHMPKKMKKQKIIFNGVEIGEFEATGDLKKDAETVEKYLKKKGLYREISEPDSIHGQANSFAEVANNIYTKYLSKSPYYGPSIAPFVVNATFSIELYLKCMHRYYGKKKRGHNLIKLFDELEKEAKDIFLQAAKGTETKYKLGKGTTIVSSLKGLSKAFQEWRYLYENNKLSTEIQSIRFTMHSCHEACCKIAEKKRITNHSKPTPKSGAV